MKLPLISGKEAIKAFENVGYRIDRQRGSHVILWKEDRPPLSVPNHKELDRGTLHSLIKAASLTLEDFINLLR